LDDKEVQLVITAMGDYRDEMFCRLGCL